MALEWEQTIVDAHDPGALGRWWQQALGWVVVNDDPDGNQFEVMWRVPREDWDEAAERGVVRALDLDRELARYGSR